MENLKIVDVNPSDLSRLKWEYELERTGFPDLLCMGTADMDFKAPQPVLYALKKVIDKGHLGYPYITDNYYDAIHEWLIKTGSWNIDARNCVANGLGIYMSASALLDILTEPGDRIAILSPVHFCFKKIISMNNRAVVECPLIQIGRRFEIDYCYLEACLKSNVKVLFLCNPHNPVGRAWTKKELETIGELCVQNNVLIMSDDVYNGLIFPKVEYTPIASLSRDISQRTITLYSPSKCYNTSGLKHSFIVAENLQILMKYQEFLEKLNLDYGGNTMGVVATIAAYNECDEWLSLLMEKIQKSHQYVTEYFAVNMPEAIVADAEATYFAWINMSALGINPKKISYLIEQEEHLVVENGVEQGKGGSGFIRMNLATSEKNIQEGVRRLKHFWDHHL
ncbi:MAG: aminotransferase class I/II-fold pyridoxal phosphate-dependent enzyme [Fastidiosipila sp.]|nr:aminotransferase class I/II-fold pyridoxal phosphate-dependent enzyme [Fastidiosipila sp.]